MALFMDGLVNINLSILREVFYLFIMPLKIIEAKAFTF